VSEAIAKSADNSFMYAFSSFLSYIRSTLRPGTIYFIRDPSDQSYSPVKDILERPTMSQLRKVSMIGDWRKR
jgi:E3 ubiquitin-protein ligase MARCH6